MLAQLRCGPLCEHREEVFIRGYREVQLKYSRMIISNKEWGDVQTFTGLVKVSGESFLGVSWRGEDLKAVGLCQYLPKAES